MWTDLLTWCADLAVIFSVVVAYRAFSADQRDRRERDTHRRAALNVALRHELQQIQQTAALDLARFRPNGPDAAPPYGQHPAIKRASNDLQVQGEYGYRRSFAWTPLLSGAIVQAIREAPLLKLTPEQTRQLSELSSAIVRTDARITSKNSLLPAIVQGQRQQSTYVTYDPRDWAAMVADQLNSAIEDDLREISRLCSQIPDATPESAGR